MKRSIVRVICLAALLTAIPAWRATADEKPSTKKPEPAQKEKTARPECKRGEIHKVVDLKPVEKAKK